MQSQRLRRERKVRVSNQLHLEVSARSKADNFATMAALPEEDGCACSARGCFAESRIADPPLARHNLLFWRFTMVPSDEKYVSENISWQAHVTIHLDVPPTSNPLQDLSLLNPSINMH